MISDLTALLGSLGSRKFLNVAKEGHVLHRARAHLEFPG